MVDAILEATIELLVEEGPQTTTNRIAERAGVSVGSLYRYFPNKDALFDGAAERYATRILSVVESLEFRPGVIPPTAAVRETVLRVLAVDDEFPGLGAVLNRMRFAGRPFPAMDAMEQRAEQLVLEALASIWPRGGRPIAAVATVGIRAFSATMRVNHAFRPSEFSRPGFIDELVHLFSAYMDGVRDTQSEGTTPPEP